MNKAKAQCLIPALLTRTEPALTSVIPRLVNYAAGHVRNLCLIRATHPEREVRVRTWPALLHATSENLYRDCQAYLIRPSFSSLFLFIFAFVLQGTPYQIHYAANASPEIAGSIPSAIRVVYRELTAVHSGPLPRTEQT